MAQIEIIKTKVPVMKPTNSRTPIEVGDTLTLVLNTDDEAYETVDVEVAYADELNREYGWDRDEADQDYRSLDVKRVHHSHTPACS